VLNKKSVNEIAEEFRRRFGREPGWLIAAPGRVNLIGEHTDYNDGFVLPMAIERHTVIAAARRVGAQPPTINAYSLNLDDEDEFVVAQDSLISSGKWTDYIKGVLSEFLVRGLAAESLDLLVSSNVPMGCGLSSSAALQVAMARLLQQLDPAVVSNEDVPALCQMAEHKFAGVPVGIMDQFCIANARQDHVVYLDCRAVQAEHIPFEDPHVAVLIVDSHVSRKLRSGAYAERRSQCDEACRMLGINKLRDTSEEIVEAAKEALGDIPYRRAKHVTSEDARTTEAVAAMRQKKWARFGELMYQSHESLRHDFEVSCTELDTLVDLAKEIDSVGGVFGARMTGGGFGGCMVALIELEKANEIIESLSNSYHDATARELTAYVSCPVAGARLIEPHDLESL